MKIKRLYGENIYSYETLEFKFDNYPGGTTLLLGKSLDEKTSNGAGKSSIMKALYFCIYGADVQGANIGEVSRRGATKGYYLSLEFEENGHEFKIERFDGRKDKSANGKGLNFFIDGELFNGVKKGTKEFSREETQENINQKVKFTPRLFLSSVYSAQSEKSNFLTKSDTDKKELLAELLDLQAYTKAHKYVKEQITALEKKREEKETRIANLKDQIDTFKEEILELGIKRDHKTKENKELVKKEEQKWLDNNRKLKKISENKKNFDLAAIEESLSKLSKEKEKIEEDLKAEQQVDLGLVRVVGSILELQNYNLSHQESISNLQAENLEFDSVSYDEKGHEKLKHTISSLEMEIQDLELKKEQLSKLNISINNEENKVLTLDKEIENLKKEIKDLEESEICPTCARPLEDEHRDHVKKQISQKSREKTEKDSQLKELSLIVKNLHKEQKNLVKDLSSLNELKISLKEKIKQNQEEEIVLEKYKIKNEQKIKNLDKIESLNKEVQLNIDKIKELELKKEELEKIALELIPFKERLQVVSKEISSLDKDFISAQVEEKEFQQILLSKESLESDQEELKQSILKLRENPNPFTEMIDRLEKRIIDFHKKIEEFQALIDKDQDQLKYYGFWEIGFAPTGIKSFITDDVIELLNQRVQANLNDLFDGALSVFFDPESKNNKGVVSNKISTSFFLKGREASYESLSAGEKRRAILATELAISEIAESRSGNKLNIRFLDEPFDGMDSNGQLRAFALFSRLSKDKDGFFVISHDESFQNMCSNVIYVLKKNEISRIVDKATYNRINIETDESDIPVENSPEISDSSKSKEEILAERLKKIREKNEKSQPSN